MMIKKDENEEDEEELKKEKQKTMFEMVKDIILCKVFIVNNNKSTITRV